MTEFVTTPVERMPGTLITLPKPHPRYPESCRLFCSEHVEVVRRELERRGVSADIEISSLPYMEPELLFGKRIEGADRRARTDDVYWFYSTVSTAPSATRLARSDIVELWLAREFQMYMERMQRVSLDQLFGLIYEVTPLSSRMSLSMVDVGSSFVFLQEGAMAQVAAMDPFDRWDHPDPHKRILARILNVSAPFRRTWVLAAKKREAGGAYRCLLRSLSEQVVLSIPKRDKEEDVFRLGYSSDIRVQLVQKG